MRDGWVGGGSWVDKWSLWKSTKAWKSNGVNNFRWISIDSRNPSDIVLWHFTNIDLTFSVQPVFIFHSSKQMVASWWLVWIHCREPKSTFPNFTNQGQDIKGYGTEFRSCSLSLLQHFMPYLDLHLGMLSPALCSVWLGYLVGLLLWTVSWMCLEMIFQMVDDGWSVQWPIQHLGDCSIPMTQKTIHSKSGCPGCPDSAENSNFPQKDCLRTQKLSVSVPES